jgi:hypothetical protein
MRWAAYEARIVDIKSAYKTLSGKLKGRDALENVEVDRRIILKLMLRK